MIKRNLSYLIISFVFIISSCDKKNTTNYYFDTILGDDTNIGTSKSKPFKNLSKIKELQLKNGDSLLLATNQIFDEPLEIIGVSGSKEEPIVISSYSKKGRGKRPKTL